MTTVPFSRLIQRPTSVIAELEHGDVLLERRGEEPLRLSRARSSDRELAAVQLLAQLVAATLTDDTFTDRLAAGLEAPLPWIALLPLEERREFVGEFLRVARACAAVGRFGKLDVTLNAWRDTAQIYADPQLLHRLRHPDEIEAQEAAPPAEDTDG
jgi:hypothetical protein